MANVSIERTHNDNFTRVSIGELDVYYSYETPVALAYPGLGRIKSENVWTRTTGRHLASVTGAREVSIQEFRDTLSSIADTISVPASLSA